jgi:hypothetical protein
MFKQTEFKLKALIIAHLILCLAGIYMITDGSTEWIVVVLLNLAFGSVWGYRLVKGEY